MEKVPNENALFSLEKEKEREKKRLIDFISVYIHIYIYFPFLIPLSQTYAIYMQYIQ